MHAFMDQQLSQKIAANPKLLVDSGLRNTTVSVAAEGLGSWTFRFDDQGSVALESGLSQSAACVIETKKDTFDGMLTGQVNVATAYLFRKIKIKGDTQLAIQLGLALKKQFRS
jgi:hypothetical protein